MLYHAGAVTVMLIEYPENPYMWIRFTRGASRCAIFEHLFHTHDVSTFSNHQLSPRDLRALIRNTSILRRYAASHGNNTSIAKDTRDKWMLVPRPPQGHPTLRLACARPDYTYSQPNTTRAATGKRNMIEYPTHAGGESLIKRVDTKETVWDRLGVWVNL